MITITVTIISETIATVITITVTIISVMIATMITLTVTNKCNDSYNDNFNGN